MLRSIPLLLSLISASHNFTNISFNAHLISDHLLGNSLFNTSKLIIAQQKPPTLRKEGFLFQFTGCLKTSDDILVCSFVVKNEQRTTRSLSIFTHGTRIVDSAGNEFIASNVILGNDSSIVIATNRLPRNVSITGSAIFRGSITNTISLFEIRTASFNVEFIKE